MFSFDSCLLQQSFGKSPIGYKPLLGHPGVDTACGYGSDIVSPVNGIVYSVFSPAKPAKDGYTGVYIFCESELETFEFVIGHCSELLVKPGDTVSKGQVIAKEGNKGYVFLGDLRITLEMQKAGNTLGSHRHYQKRPLQASNSPSNAIRNEKGAWRHKDKYWVYKMPTNGYKGCVDFTQPLFNRDLYLGSRGYDVTLLQRAMGLPPEYQTGFFGVKTLGAVSAFQALNGLTPSVGYCGTKTRTLLNNNFKQL